jgi:hypothetical protein
LMRAQKPILTNAEKPRYPKFLTTPAAIWSIIFLYMFSDLLPRYCILGSILGFLTVRHFLLANWRLLFGR